MKEQIIQHITPSEDHNHDYIDQIEFYNRQRNSVLRQLMHTAVGAIGDERVFQYENFEGNYIELEDGIMLAVE